MTRRIAALAVALLLAMLIAAPAGAQPRRFGGREFEQLYQELRTKLDAIEQGYQDEPVIELVTMGVGSLIWERHGHIALCVHYDARRNDCYNYGVGDFYHPLGMAWGFLRAGGAFWVEKRPIDEMLPIYLYTDRTIWVQPLPLTAAQKQQVIAKLERDILEQNRYYAYDHFWDNCTTRVRNILDDAIGGKLSAMTAPSDGKTFRDLAREGFFEVHLPQTGDVPVPLLITDLAMGRATDRVPTYYERMFLPQYLREAVARLWGIQPIAIYERHGEPPVSDGPSGRVWLALVIVLLTSPAWITRLIGRFQRTGLALAVIPYMLLGTVLTGVAILSPLPYLRWNELCLVLLPLDVLVLVLPAARRRAYARGRVVMLAAILVCSLVGILKQPLLAPLLWPAIPLAVAGFWPARPVRVGQAGESTGGGKRARSGAGAKHSKRS
jgi:hypothetical protein